MTRKFPLLFTISLGFIFFLLLGLVGKGGYFHNQSLKAEIEERRYQTEVLALQVESLQKQRSEALSQDALKDAAFKYGYQREGEQVFYFQLDEEEDLIQMGNPPPLVQTSQFTGIRVTYIFLIALVISTTITVCFMLLTRRKGGSND